MPTDVIMPALGMAQETGQGPALAQGGGRHGREGRAAARDRDRQGDRRDRGAGRRDARRRSARPRATRCRSARRSPSCSPPARACAEAPPRRRGAAAAPASGGGAVATAAAGARRAAARRSPRRRRGGSRRSGASTSPRSPAAGPGGAVVAADVETLAQTAGRRPLPRSGVWRLMARADDGELAVGAALLPPPRGRRVAPRELARRVRAQPGHERREPHRPAREARRPRLFAATRA